jgi:hypothetical protein
MSQLDIELKNAADRARDEAIAIERHHFKQAWAIYRHQGEAHIRRMYTRTNIKSMNERGGYYFFSKDTMRFFGDRTSNYCVVVKGDSIRIRRIKEPSKPPQGTIPAGTWYTFDPETGNIKKELSDAS